jgi:hypothetical protein
MWSQNQFPHSELTQEFAIQGKKNGEFVFRIHHKSTAIGIREFFPFRSIGSFRQLKVIMVSGKKAFISIKTSLNLNCIRISAPANDFASRNGARRETNPNYTKNKKELTSLISFITNDCEIKKSLTKERITQRLRNNRVLCPGNCPLENTSGKFRIPSQQ